MVERNPWHSRVKGPFPEKYGCVGVKEDGGGSMRGRGLVGKMRIHRAVFNRDVDLIKKLIAEGDDVNEVEAAGNTPLHNAAYDGWCEGIELLCEHGAKVNASNNVRSRHSHARTHTVPHTAPQLSSHHAPRPHSCVSPPRTKKKEREKKTKTEEDQKTRHSPRASALHPTVTIQKKTTARSTGWRHGISVGLEHVPGRRRRAPRGEGRG